MSAGFAPDDFWEQTPATFQACMNGWRRRAEMEAEQRVTLAYQTASFTAASQSKAGLKPLRYYLRKPGATQSGTEMLTALKAMNAPGMKIRRLPTGP